jgi:small subunit ribosomal protein S21
MRIAGEIVNSRSAAADLTQSRSTRSATRRLDTKAGDSYCSLSPACPFGYTGKYRLCLKSCPKNGDVPKSSFLPIGSHGAHRQAHSQISTLVLRRVPIGIRTMPIRGPVVGASLAIGPVNRSIEEERRVQVLVRDNNVDQALKVLKKKMQREGVFREMKLRGHYEKPSERRVREKAEAIRRARKLARKKLQREGLLPMKPRVIPGAPGRGGPARAPRF